VSKTVSHLTAADDGETLGQLRRPSGGFRVGGGYSIVPTVGQLSPEERSPTTPDELWLVPTGPPETTAWLRDSPDRPRPGLLRRFADLHDRGDEQIRRFASEQGWLRAGTLIVPVTNDMSGAGPYTPPVWGDRLRTWQQESRTLAELMKVADDAGRLREHHSEDARRALLEHVQSPEGETLWLGPEAPGVRRTPPRGGWRTVPWQEWTWERPEGAQYANALAFTWGSGRHVIFLPFPAQGARPYSAAGHGRGGPAWGSDLSQAESAALAEMVLYALGCVVQTFLRDETHAVLTLRKAIRVAPSSLLGALYLNFARELIFERKGQKVCPACRQAFNPLRRDQKWCGDACKSRGWRTRRRRKAVRIAVNTARRKSA